VREEEREKQQDLHARLRTIQDELQVEEESVSAAKQSLERLIARREEKALDLAQIHARRSAIEVELQETEVSVLEDNYVNLINTRDELVHSLR
jgi:multidrug resistance efflux pump